MIDPIIELRKRLAKGLTQAELSEEIGVSPPFLCLVLKGTKAPGTRILSYLGLQKPTVRRYERITTATGPNGSGRKRQASNRS